MVWAHLLSNTGAFTNPFEYREVMCASVGWVDKTVEQVEAEHEQRRAQREATAKAKGARTGNASSRAPVAAGATPVAATELQKMQEMLLAGQRLRDQQAAEAAAKPTPRKRKPKAPVTPE